MTIPRILALPTKTPYNGDLAADLTAALKTRRGTESLRPIQAEALYEAMNARGLFAPMQVGTGKTHVSMLLPTILGANKPLLLTRAALRKKTWKHYFAIRKHWNVPTNLKIRSYEELSSKSGANMLDMYQPDLIICDEVHRVLNAKESARGRRLWRFMDDDSRPPVMFCALSGTILSRSVQDMWKASLFALAEGSPVPYDFVALAALAAVTDHKVREPASRLERRIVAKLADLCEDPEARLFADRVRDGFRRRLHATPGVVVSFTKGPDVSLQISQRKVELPERVKNALERMYKLWIDPDGNEIPGPLQLYGVARQLSAGFYYRTVWPGGVVDHEWLNARNAWNKLVRTELKQNREHRDSTLLVFEWYKRNDPTCPELQAWLAVRDRPAPPREPVWIDEFLVNDSLAWARQQKRDVILWFEHDAIGNKYREKLGPNFVFGAGTTMPEDEAPSNIVAVSWRVHSEGCNLQYVWHNQLIVQPPTSPRDWEQLLGRMHREGQVHDVNTVISVPTEEMSISLTDSRDQARVLERTVGVPQKLVYADWLEE